MMLIIQIAIGIVLAVIILAYLPEIIGLFFTIVALAALVGVLIALFIFRNEIFEFLLGVAFPIVLIFGFLYVVNESKTADVWPPQNEHINNPIKRGIVIFLSINKGQLYLLTGLIIFLLAMLSYFSLTSVI
ncbi:hypothetical protein JYU22_00855 [Gammaproteobacteria bacterium AH-315-E17]|nr:hypothetical protein [Gammaproteobacteria bacterium AH-315-E17]